MRGTRTFPSTGSNCGESPRCPAVTTTDILALPDGQAELGGEPAARPSQPMITGLGEDTVRWFLLQVALLAGPGRMSGAGRRGEAVGAEDSAGPHVREVGEADVGEFTEDVGPCSA